MSSKSHQERAILLFTAYAVGRSGEVKFNKFSNWVFDPRFNLTDTCWTEIKTTNIYSSPQVNVYARDSFAVDWYHAMGCYGSLEKGFITTQKELSDFVFPPLHRMTDNNVSIYITRIICNNVGKDVPKDVLNSLSSRLLR